MKRPSTRTVVIVGVAFAAGFVAAVALASGTLIWFGQQSLHANQGRIISGLVTTTELLDVNARQPAQLLSNVIGKSDEQSLTAATQFGALGSTYQPMVLRLFAHMNRNATLDANHDPASNAARLARVMVLCARHSASPGWVDFNKDTGATVGIPTWVLDPRAKPEHPETVTYGNLRFVDAKQVDAITRHWDALHTWVVQHQACARENRLTPESAHQTVG